MALACSLSVWSNVEVNQMSDTDCSIYKSPFFFTVVGEFIDDTADWSQQVTLGTSVTFKCPAHHPSNFVDYFWTGKDIKIQLQMNERRAIKPNGDLVILFVTLEDVNDIKGLGGIQCTMTAANTFYSSGALTLTTPQGNLAMTKHLIRESSF